MHVIWTPGPGSYGRNDADDAAMDAAVLAKAVGKPVRVQYMRDQGTGWDPKGPASIHHGARRDRCRGQRHRLRLPEQGLLARRRQHQRQQAVRHAGRARRSASRSNPATASACRRNPTRFANKRTAWETIAPLLDRASPLRTSHLRDPVGPQIHFASESFMDEVAAALERRPGRIPAALRQGPARHRRHQGGGGEGGLAIAAVAAQGPDRRQGLRPRHRLRAAQRHARRHGRRGRCRPPQRQDLGAQVHGRP